MRRIQRARPFLRNLGAPSARGAWGRRDALGRPSRRFAVVPLAAVAFLVAGAAPAPTPGPSRTSVVRVAFSEAMFVDVNPNDARASVKAWAEQFLRDMGLDLTLETRIESDPAVLRADIASGRLDIVTLTTDEFFALDAGAAIGPIFISEQAGATTEEYVLLVQAAAPIRTLADLRGKTIAVHENPRTCLARPWFDLALRAEGLPGAEGLPVYVSRSTKLSTAVLPVFFGKSDACLVTRSGFDAMGELNPQVARGLRVVASSPAVVPRLVFIRSDFDPSLMSRAEQSLLNAHEKTTGHQLLTLFGASRLVRAPAGCFDTARALLGGRTKRVPAGQAHAGQAERGAGS